MPKYKSQKSAVRYTVYDNKTDLPVIVYGTAEECARAMGVNVKTFYHLVRGRKVNGNRWFVMKEEADDE